MFATLAHPCWIKLEDDFQYAFAGITDTTVGKRVAVRKIGVFAVKVERGPVAGTPRKIRSKGPPLVPPVNDASASRDTTSHFLDPVVERLEHVKPAAHCDGNVCVYTASLIQINLVVSIWQWIVSFTT